MRIALVTNWYSENMGYSENILPKALGHLGHEVHVISSTAQVYYNSPSYADTYRTYLGPPVVAPGTKRIGNHELHRLPFTDRAGLVIQGLPEKIATLKPDIVQTFDIDFNVYRLAQCEPSLKFRLFTEMHLHASVFPNYKSLGPIGRLRWFWRIGRYMPLINARTVLCYPIAEDCADIARVIYKVPAEKLKLQSLGTDTQWFTPCTTAEQQADREHLREKLGFSPSDIVCIYTGRITRDKGPALLAKAISILHARGETDFKALFVGLGEPAEMNSIRQVPGCVLTDFVRAMELPRYYRCAEIGVWPLQESTSQLDAIACGLPLIVNDTVTVRQRVEGNGLFYRMGDANDLATQMLKLKKPSVRKEMGDRGTRNASENFSWITLARERVADYTAAIQSKRPE